MYYVIHGYGIWIDISLNFLIQKQNGIPQFDLYFMVEDLHLFFIRRR
jgi:hypothetical protein